MRKTAAYIFSIIFLFIAGLAILHPSYRAISDWLSPLTGGFIYTIFIVFTLLIANPLKYLAVGMIWVSAGFIIGLISQKKLGASIVALFTWLSMIPTLAVAAFGVFSNLETRGLLTIDSPQEILRIIPNVPSSLNFNSLFELPIISEILFQTIDLIPTFNENTDPMQIAISMVMPHATAFIMKPLIIIISAIIGAEIGKQIFSRIDLSMLLGRKIAATLLIGLIASQAVYLPLANSQTPELDEETLAMLEMLGLDIEDLDFETLEEYGITPEVIEQIAGMDPEELNFETLTDLGLDPEIAMGVVMGLSGSMNNTEGGEPELDISLNTDDGLYVELIGGYADNQGFAVTGELLLGSDIETVPPTASYVQDLAASVILTQNIFDPTVLYKLPVEGYEDYIQFAGVAPELVAVNVYAGEDIQSFTTKSDELISEYESLYGVQFSRVTAIKQSFEPEDGSISEHPPFIVCVYYSLDSLGEVIPNILTGFEDKNGLADSFQDIIDGERKEVELYATGQVSPVYMQDFIPASEDMSLFQPLIDALLGETFHFALGAQLIDKAVSESTFDLSESLGLSNPRFSNEADIGLMAVARPNNTNPEPSLKLSTNIDQSSMEFMFIYMYLNTIMPMEISGGMTPDAEDLRISLPDLGGVIDVEKTTQTSGGVETVTITITNYGNSAISNLQLTDLFPEKYEVLDSGINTATWTRLAPGASVTHSYAASYDKPGTYTNSPTILRYEENGETRSTVSNMLPATTKNPNGFTLLSENYRATFDILDRITGNGDLFGMVPIVFIALIAAIDLFKMYRNRSKTDAQPQVEVSPPDPPIDEDTPEDPL